MALAPAALRAAGERSRRLGSTSSRRLLCNAPAFVAVLIWMQATYVFVALSRAAPPHSRTRTAPRSILDADSDVDSLSSRWLSSRQQPTQTLRSGLITFGAAVCLTASLVVGVANAAEPVVAAAQVVPQVGLVAAAAQVEPVRGQAIFAGNCAACHAGGVNKVQVEKTLMKDILTGYGMFDVEKIVYQVENGKNAMPAFGERLSKVDIEDVSAFVIKSAENDWK